MDWGEWFRRAMGAFRREPERSLAQFQKAPATTTILNIYVEQIVFDNSINYGARVQGNVNILGPLNNAFNTINNIDRSTDEGKTLQPLLKSLHDETAKLIEALSAKDETKDEAERAARNLRNLTEAATAKKPDREWFDVSAKRLLEAAKAVASLTAPVTAAVKAVLEFFKP